MNIEPGKALRVNGDEITTKCGDGMLQSIEHDRIVPLKAGDCL